MASDCGTCVGVDGIDVGGTGVNGDSIENADGEKAFAELVGVCTVGLGSFLCFVSEGIVAISSPLASIRDN